MPLLQQVGLWRKKLGRLRFVSTFYLTKNIYIFRFLITENAKAADPGLKRVLSKHWSVNVFCISVIYFHSKQMSHILMIGIRILCMSTKRIIDGFDVHSSRCRLFTVTSLKSLPLHVCRLLTVCRLFVDFFFFCNFHKDPVFSVFA